jgi:hypothetical protein
MGRQKDKNTGEYYISPTDSRIDIKIPLDQNTLSLTTGKIGPVDTLPHEVSFKTPLMNTDPYLLIELPQSDPTRSPYM